MKLDKFRNARFTRPTAYVEVAELVGIMFDKDEDPKLKVRGLTANEMYLAKESMSKNSPLRILAQAAAGGDKSALGDAFKRIMGNDRDAVAAETSFRIEILVLGVVDEEGEMVLDYADVAKLGEHFPAVFLRLSDRIHVLSGEASLAQGEK